jgi:putative PIN family toxin of toxin-antitoxin system
MPLSAVLDTNVLVSGLIAAEGAPRQILDAWLEGRYTLVSSLYLVEELVHVLSYPRIAERLPLEDAELGGGSDSRPTPPAGSDAGCQG